MPIAGIKVLFIDKSWDVPYEVSVCGRMHGLMTQIAKFDPDVIVTSTVMPGVLNHADFELRKKWIHVDPSSDVGPVMNAIESCYIGNLWGEHPNQAANQLVSVYTASYNTGDYLHDAYHSLREQTYTNWEWVVVDDESTDGTWDKLLVMANEDHRVRPVRIRHNGRIGFTKDLATRLSTGKYLIEFDHDDTLAETAVDEVRKAFDADPEVGMVYSNCACLFADGSPHRFNDDFWKDRYRWTEYRGKKFLEAINPDIYDRFGPHHSQQFGWFLTVGPNHLRAYRMEFLKELGGYNPRLSVADDWDLYARAFLASVPPECR